MPHEKNIGRIRWRLSKRKHEAIGRHLFIQVAVDAGHEVEFVSLNSKKDDSILVDKIESSSFYESENIII